MDERWALQAVCGFVHIKSCDASSADRALPILGRQRAALGRGLCPRSLPTPIRAYSKHTASALPALSATLLPLPFLTRRQRLRPAHVPVGIWEAIAHHLGRQLVQHPHPAAGRAPRVPAAAAPAVRHRSCLAAPAAAERALSACAGGGRGRAHNSARLPLRQRRRVARRWLADCQGVRAQLCPTAPG